MRLTLTAAPALLSLPVQRRSRSGTGLATNASCQRCDRVVRSVRGHRYCRNCRIVWALMQ